MSTWLDLAEEGILLPSGGLDPQRGAHERSPERFREAVLQNQRSTRKHARPLVHVQRLGWLGPGPESDRLKQRMEAIRELHANGIPRSDFAGRDHDAHDAWLPDEMPRRISVEDGAPNVWRGSVPCKRGLGAAYEAL
jgi:hypothetical protein